MFINEYPKFIKINAVKELSNNLRSGNNKI